MGIALLLILGAAIGWVVSIGVCTDNMQCITANALAGAAGAPIAAMLSHGFLGTSDVIAGAVGLGALSIAIVGGLIASVSVHLFRHGSLV